MSRCAISPRLVYAALLCFSWYALAGAPAAVAQASAPSAIAASDVAATDPGVPVSSAPGSSVAGSAVSLSDDSIPPITVQIEPPPISISSSMIGVAGPLGAQAVAGKPIAAEFVTKHHQSFTDGNRISRTTTSVIYRDALGRVRRESQLSVPGLRAGVASANFITIVDHHLGCGWVLDPKELVAHRYELNGPGPSYVARVSAQGSGSGLHAPDSKAATDAAATSGDSSRWRQHVFAPYQGRPWQDTPAVASNSAAGSGSQSEESGVAGAPAMRIDQPFLAAPNPVRTENLGEELILGFRVHGTRVITTLPPGEIGNDLPIHIVSEQWFSPELDLVMRSAHRDPWGGDFTTTVTKIKRGDQPTWLFEVPATYKIIDSATEGEHHLLDSRGNHATGAQSW